MKEKMELILKVALLLLTLTAVKCQAEGSNVDINTSDQIDCSAPFSIESPSEQILRPFESSGPLPVFRKQDDANSPEEQQTTVLGPSENDSEDSAKENSLNNKPENVVSDGIVTTSTTISPDTSTQADVLLNTLTKLTEEANDVEQNNQDGGGIDGAKTNKAPSSQDPIEFGQSGPLHQFSGNTNANNQVSDLDLQNTSGQEGRVTLPSSKGNSLQNDKEGKNLLNDNPNDSFLDFQPQNNLYVSVQQSVPASSAPFCTFPDQFSKDPLELSTSEFGYPKSIVEQTLRNSVAEAVLKTLSDMMYEGILATHVPGQSLYGPSSLANSNVYNGYLLNKPITKGFENNLNTLDNSNLNGAGGKDLGSSSFGRLGTSLGDSNFGKLSSLNNRISTIALGSSLNGNGIRSLRQQSSTARQRNGNAETSVQKVQIDEGPNTKQPNYTGSSIKDGNSDDLAASSTRSTDNGRVGGAREDNTSILGSAARVNPKFPSPSSGLGNYNTFTTGSLGSNSTVTNTKLFGSSAIDRLFPPKRSDHFLDEPPGPVGGAKDGPLISYQGGRRDEAVASPFSFNSQSLFGSLSGSPFGRTGTGSQSLKENNNGISSSFGSSNFGSGSSLFPPGSNSNFNRLTNQGISEKSPQFGFLRGFRQKRQAEFNPVTSVNSACKSTHKVLRQYKHYGGTCFVVMPEAQGIYYAECSNAPCSGCRFEGGASRCVGERAPVWVWSYCEEGPQAGKVMPDRVQVTVTCTCNTAICQSSIPGR